MSGYLSKLGFHGWKWKTYWFVLSNGYISYYTTKVFFFSWVTLLISPTEHQESTSAKAKLPLYQLEIEDFERGKFHGTAIVVRLEMDEVTFLCHPLLSPTSHDALVAGFLCVMFYRHTKAELF